jgi:hypothetical protein
MRKSHLLTLLLIALAATPARAAYFPADGIDGPSADILAVGDADLARDGSGAVVYVKRDAGVAHIFAARILNGAWQPPERLDPGLDADASQPVVAAADRGRLVAAFVSGGQLFGTSRNPGATTWSAPQQIAAAASDPSLDLSINGVAYVTYTAAGDVLGARLARDATTWAGLEQPLDIDVADVSGRSDVALSADGVANTAFVEGSRVVARKLFGTKVSQVPQVLNVDQVEGHAGGASSAPDIDVEDDSSFAWVVFRQEFDDHPRVLARRLLGSTFEPPVVVDGGTSASAPRIDLSGRGEGITASATPDNGIVADLLHLDLFGAAARIDTPPTALGPAAVPTIGENGSATVSWLQAPTAADAVAVHARRWFIDQAKRGFPLPEADTVISNPAFGPVDPSAGMDSASDRLGDVVTAFIQGTGADRRLAVAEYDRPPGFLLGYAGSGYRSLRYKGLKWSASSEIWGAVTYTVMVDGKVIGTTTSTHLKPSVRIRDGDHLWQVIATDQRGQSARTRSARLRVDDTPPSLHVKVTRSGNTVTVVSRARDKRSGLRSIVTTFGDGARREGSRVSHRYRAAGSYQLVVRATDEAGARRLSARTIRVKKH